MKTRVQTVSGRTAFWTACCLGLLALLGQGATFASAQDFTFQGLGHLDDRIRESGARAVSGDGSVVVGYSSSGPRTFEAFRWTAADGMVGLGNLADANSDSSVSAALGVSADGVVVVGYGHSETRPRAFRWTEAAGMVDLGNNSRRAFAVSVDGSVVVGERRSGSDYEAFHWTEAGGVVGLGYLWSPPEWSPISAAYGVSGDGAVVVGASSSGSGNMEAFRWTQTGGMVGLGDLPGGSIHSGARAVSADGSVVVGYSDSASGREAFRWTQTGGMVGLGDLPGGSFASYAWGVSADGTVVVGRGTTDLGPEAFIWDAEYGMMNLKSILIAGGLNLDGWTLTDAWSVSADGSTIVGTGINPEGQIEAWRATVAPLPIGQNQLPTASFTVVVDGLTVHFDAGSSNDPDGSIVSYDWDFGDSNTGSGVMVSHSYASPGTYTIWLLVTDNEGATNGAALEVTLSGDDGIILSATGYKVRGLQKADLVWTGALSDHVDVYRNGVRIATVTNTGAWTDPINLRGSGTYTYWICEVGTATCSNEATVVFH